MSGGMDDFDTVPEEGTPILTVEVREEGECLVRCFAAYELPNPTHHPAVQISAEQKSDDSKC